MSGPQFFQTRMGAQFYEGTMPALVRELRRLNDYMGQAVGHAAQALNTEGLPPGAVKRLLDLSTAHIDLSAASALETLTAAGPGNLALRNPVTDEVEEYVEVCSRGDYGWLLSVPLWDGKDLAALTCDKAVTTVLDVLTYARRHNVDWVVLDRDADVVPNLRQYDW